ncbi:nucleic acid-binding, OB-fold protein [Tanacetum coccineum]
MSQVNLTQGSIPQISNIDTKSNEFKPIVQIVDVRLVQSPGGGGGGGGGENKERYRVLLSDGVWHQQGMLATQQNELVRNNQLHKGSIVLLTQFVCNMIRDRVNDIKIDLSKEFLVELRKNMYHGTHYEDLVDHIAKVLKMVDSIYVPGVDSHQLRMKVFPLSLADDAKKWWISDGNEKITTWEELVEKFFYRFYPESYDGEDELLDEGKN